MLKLTIGIRSNAIAITRALFFIFVGSLRLLVTDRQF